MASVLAPIVNKVMNYTSEDYNTPLSLSLHSLQSTSISSSLVLVLFRHAVTKTRI